MLQGLILIEALSSACWEKNEKKRKKETRSGWGLFLQGLSWTCLAGSTWWDF
jgi:hypothetical protein